MISILFIYYFLILSFSNPLPYTPLSATPGVDAMQLAILSLDDAWIGILVDRTVLQGEEMAANGAVIADGKTQWRARSLLGSRQRLEIVVDEHVSAILQGNSIRTARLFSISSRVTGVQVSPPSLLKLVASLAL